MATTPNYGWVTPAPTDFVTDLPADFEVFADAVDADLAGLLGGTTGQSLVKDSNSDHDFSWQTVGGGFTQIATGNLTGASVSITSIPATYKKLVLQVFDYRPASTQNLYVQLNTDTGNNYNYMFASAMNQAPGSNYWNIGANQNSTTSDSFHNLELLNYASTTTFKLARGTAITNNATTATNVNYFVADYFWYSTSAINSIQLFPSIGNFTSGTYFLYGVS